MSIHLPATTGNSSALLAVAEQGYALLPAQHALGAARVQLSRWEKVTGVSMRDDKPVPREKVGLNWQRQIGERDPLISVSFGLSATTDEKGRFEMSYCIAGDAVAQRTVFHSEQNRIENEQTNIVTVRSGARNEIVTGRSRGWQVVAHLTSPAGAAAADWFARAFVILQPDMQMAFPASTAGNPAEQQKWIASEAGQAYLRQTQVLMRQGTVDASGRIRIDDVLPGDYRLLVRIQQNNDAASTQWSRFVSR